MQKKPEIIVFAGPNGSGKSTITKLAKIIEPYINADNIKTSIHCSDMEAAQKATELREVCVRDGISFTFETVLSTDRNLKLLQRAKENGYVKTIMDRKRTIDELKNTNSSISVTDSGISKKSIPLA